MRKISFKQLKHKLLPHKHGSPSRRLSSRVPRIPVRGFFRVLLVAMQRIFRSMQKIKHTVVDVLGEIHHKVERNKFLSNQYFTRIVILCFFLGINIQLLPFFLKTNRIQLPEKILTALDFIGIVDKAELNFEYSPQGLQEKMPSLEPNILFEKLNVERELRKKEPFEYSQKLASAAAELLTEAEKYEFELQDRPFTEELRTALKNANYNFEHVSHNMVVGPLLEDAVIDAWLSSKQQTSALFEDDFKQVGLATKVIKTKYNETLGVTVQILGTEFPQKTTATVTFTQPATQKSTAQKIVFPPISNNEVFAALNTYRESHGIHKLQSNEHLCAYAQKRVQDLIALGTLDNHDGFKRDFADPENLPLAIQNYKGKKIAENLAYQHCRNMTTGDAFIAQTGTALIEWCFDSSTAGHKEAQLSREFSHACVGNGNGFFVIIFGAD